MTPKTYQDNFFGFHSDDSFNSAKEVIPVILQFIKPVSVIDIGCGAGNWLYNWKELGVTDFLGVDGSYVRAEDLIIDRNNFFFFFNDTATTEIYTLSLHKALPI